MKKLIRGIVDFRKSLCKNKKALFAKLSSGQKPDALFITCSDSRVVPNLLVSTDPGDLFVLRNVGNIVPLFELDPGHQDNSVFAALEFALFSLKIKDIIVCGHSECGAIERVSKLSKKSCPHLQSWFKYIGKPLKNRQKLVFDKSLSKPNQLSQINVLKQIEHLQSYPFVQDLLAKKKLQLHGWWFDIAKADVYCYEDCLKRFILIDEKEALEILKRLS